MEQPGLGVLVSYGWEQVKKYPLFHIVGVFLVPLIGAFTMCILLGPLLAGYMSEVRKADAGQEPEIGGIFSNAFKQNVGAAILVSFLPFVVLFAINIILIGIATVLSLTIDPIIGMIFGVLVGIVFAVISLFVFPLLFMAVHRIAILGEASGMGALKQACATFGKWALPGAVFTLVGALGGLFCGIGQFITWPIAYAGLYKLAEYLSNAPAVNSETRPPAPS